MILNPVLPMDRSATVMADTSGAQIEFRMITGGLFSQHEAIKYFDYDIAGGIDNANIAHDHGFFVEPDSDHLQQGARSWCCPPASTRRGLQAALARARAVAAQLRRRGRRRERPRLPRHLRVRRRGRQRPARAQGAGRLRHRRPMAAGVAELIDGSSPTTWPPVTPGRRRHHVLLGRHRRRHPGLRFAPYACNVLVAGTRQRQVHHRRPALLERLTERPTSSASSTPRATTHARSLVTDRRAESARLCVTRCSNASATPGLPIVVNLLGVALREHPDFFSQLFPRLQEFRARTGRRVDRGRRGSSPAARPVGTCPVPLPKQLGETMLITVSSAWGLGIDPRHRRHRRGRESPSPKATLAELAAALRTVRPQTPAGGPNATTGGVARATVPPVPHHDSRPSRAPPPSREIRRGQSGTQELLLPRPGSKLNLRAQNLTAFCELAADESTTRPGSSTCGGATTPRGSVEASRTTTSPARSSRSRTLLIWTRPRVAAWSARPSTGASCFQPEAPVVVRLSAAGVTTHP